MTGTMIQHCCADAHLTPSPLLLGQHLPCHCTSKRAQWLVHLQLQVHEVLQPEAPAAAAARLADHAAPAAVCVAAAAALAAALVAAHAARAAALATVTATAAALATATPAVTAAAARVLAGTGT